MKLDKNKDGIIKLEEVNSFDVVMSYLISSHKEGDIKSIVKDFVNDNYPKVIGD